MVATVRQSSSTDSTPAPSGGCYDPLDVDSLINYDQLRSFSPSQSPLSLPAYPAAATANPNNTLLRRPSQAATTSQPPSFAGPSHQYELHKQQTGLPVGALAHTSAVNQASSLNMYREQSLFDLTADDSVFGSGPTDDLMNLSATASHHASFSAPSEMDLELNSPSPEHLPAFFYPERSQSSSAEFVDPSVLGRSEMPSRAPPPPAPLPQTNGMARLYPGVHQQQAAMAKARQQQQQQQQEAAKQNAAAAAPSAEAIAAQRLDSIAEEKIPQLLSSMRQASMAGSSDGAATPQPEPASRPHVGRSKKDEDEMDEDERLLASEEGKKLSSKERRQLRNKVSARAFRSRRKEYIGQLESELAAKNKELNDMKQENRALRDENTRLSDLTRMLLSSSAFSTFLDQLSAGGSSSASSVKAESAAAPANDQSVEPAVSSEPAAADSQSQALPDETTHVGMTLVPDAPLDLSMLDPAGNNAWAFGTLANPVWGNNQPQVFTVHDIPEGPAVDRMDPPSLSEKTFDPVASFAPLDEAKDEVPTVKTMPTITDEAPTVPEVPAVEAESSEGLDETNPAFALFVDSYQAPARSAPESAASKDSQAPTATPAGVSEKEHSHYTLTTSTDVDDESASMAAATERFNRLCRSAEAAFQRIGRITSHL